VNRAVIVASSPVARAGLEALLSKTGMITVIGNVAHWSEYTGDEPDVVIADLESGAEEFPPDPADQSPAPVTLVLADDPRQPWLAEALRSGVRGVLPRQSTASHIVAAIDAVLAGLVVLQPGDLDGLLVNPRPARMVEPLTPREIEVLGMLAEGQSNKAIAHHLGISEHTVKFHVTSIMTKLNAGSRTEAVTLGIRQGLIMI
jgi:DNA-binding NarL/FixJ family response regulator